MKTDESLTVWAGPGGTSSWKRSASWFQVRPRTDQPGRTAAGDCPESTKIHKINVSSSDRVIDWAITWSNSLYLSKYAYLYYLNHMINILITFQVSARRCYDMHWKMVSNNVSSSHLFHDADGLCAVLRRRIQKDPVVEWLQHRFHRFHTAHQTHQLCSDVTHRPHYRSDPGGGAGGAARPSALIRHTSTSTIHFQAESLQRKTRNYIPKSCSQKNVLSTDWTKNT